MKALPFKIPYGGETSIQVDHERLKQFYPHYHTHEEIQLTLIIRGSGMAYIGDRIIQFEAGEVFLIGHKLPHVFKDGQINGHGVEAISIFFLTNFLGKDFLRIPESKLVNQLLTDALRGIRVSDEISKKLEPGMHGLEQYHGLEQILLLLEMLHNIASGQNEFITGPDYHRPRRQADGEKINNVFNYLTTNYNRDISLADVANIAHMSPNAFCRYFKQHTRKSYSRFLNEIRVRQACKLLRDDSQSISQVAYSTGFNNISNFNRQFKKIIGSTPTEYLKISL